MSYQIRYHPAVHEDLDSIPANIERRIRRAIEARLMTAPDQYGERLTADLKGFWKLRVGDYRLVFEMDRPSRLVTVWAIQHRRGVYPAMVKRWLRKRETFST